MAIMEEAHNIYQKGEEKIIAFTQDTRVGILLQEIILRKMAAP
jgi:hypothetical protein